MRVRGQRNTGTGRMDPLSMVLMFKICATLLVWCVPLLVLPTSVLEWLGLPPETPWMFLRMLGWAYLALCVGYSFALTEALKGKRLVSTIWVGIVSNGGACALLLVHGCLGAWTDWGLPIQVVLWGSVAATALITAGLVAWGVEGCRGGGPGSREYRPAA